MSRFNDYDGEEEYANQGEMWWANCERALSGRRGQRDLRELLTVLEALPEKRLIYGKLVAKGEVCTVGALVVARKEKLGEERETILTALEAAYAECECVHYLSDHPEQGPCVRCAEWVEDQKDWDPGRRWAKRCESYREREYDDEGEDGVWDTVAEGVAVGLTKSLAYYLAYINDEIYFRETPEERWVKVVAWLRKQIKEPQAA